MNMLFYENNNCFFLAVKVTQSVMEGAKYTYS